MVSLKAVHGPTGKLSPQDWMTAPATKAVIKALTAGALDPYVVERNAYEQNRRYEVSNGAVPLFDLPVLAEDDKEKKKMQ